MFVRMGRARRLSFMMLLQDTRFAIRQLRRTPVFAVTAILTLGLGLGLNTMLFTLFNAYVLRTAAVQNPYSLYELGFSTKKGTKTTRFSWDQYQSIRSTSVFSDAIAADQFFARLEGKNVEGQAVSGNYFTTLGVRMALGRYILPEDAPAPGGRPVAVLSNLTWKSQFGSDPDVLGRKILINGHPFTVIGICAPEFTGIGIDILEGFYVPATMAKQVLAGTDPFGPDQPAVFAVVGRLAGGIPVDSARAALTLAVRRASEQLPEADRAAEAVLELVKAGWATRVPV